MNSPRFLTKKEIDLIALAQGVLSILESEKEWNSDTTDDISILAMDLGLAYTDENSEFAIKELTA
jgi:hypothetical protein